MIAAGAIMVWAVTTTVSVLSIIFWSNWGGFGGADRHEGGTTVVKQ